MGAATNVFKPRYFANPRRHAILRLPEKCTPRHSASLHLAIKMKSLACHTPTVRVKWAAALFIVQAAAARRARMGSMRDGQLSTPSAAQCGFQAVRVACLLPRHTSSIISCRRRRRRRSIATFLCALGLAFNLRRLVAVRVVGLDSLAESAADRLRFNWSPRLLEKVGF